MREVDLPERLVRVLARLRGMPPPPPDSRWDDRAAARLSDPAEIADGIAAYERAFVATMPPIVGVGAAIERLAARGFVLGILSNWPLASVIDRYADAQGWAPHLRAIVVSKRVGAIKPDPRIFAAAAAALDLAPGAILHVGDDWEADVVGGRRAGFRVAYLRGRQDDTHLPTSRPAAGVEADLEVDTLEEVEAAVAPARP
jgi:HAD superfamily hydrolase (TIGR01509 family)